jgi:hypothetical protein
MKSPLRLFDSIPESLRIRLRNAIRMAMRAAVRCLRSRAFIACAAIAFGLAAINGGIAIAVAAGSRNEASAWPGSSFTFWPERSWQRLEGRIRSLPLSARMQSRVLGEVTYRGSPLPIRVLRFQADRENPQPLRVLLASGVHGTESAGVEALLRFCEALAREPALHSAVAIDVLPVANPWGWVHGYRYNGEGEDVNRDFASRRTQEARLIRGFMDRSGPYDLVLDLHESKKYGYFLYQYMSPDKGLGNTYVRILQTLGRPRENSYREGIFPARNGILQIPAAALPWIAMGGRLSLEQYARLHGTPHAYTVETPLSDTFENRVEVHLRTAHEFVRRLARE